MSDNNRFYFLAFGRSLEAAKAFLDERQTALDRITELFQETGAEHATGNGTGISLNMSSSWTPKTLGWRKRAKDGHWIPDRKTPEGKALLKRMESCEIPSAMNFKCGVGPVMAGFSLLCCVPERIGSQLVISVPAHNGKCAGTPWDATPIRTSEYWAMREAAELAQFKA